jgi:hypothetical protein
MILALSLVGAAFSSLQADSISEPSDDFGSSPNPPPAPTESSPSATPRGISLTETQQIVVYAAISATAVLIVAEAALTVYCRKKNRRRIPVELEQVMLPSPDEAYGLAPL